MSYCKIIIQGNLCQDPEIKYTVKGSAICNFTIAINRQWKDESGQKKEEVSFIPVVAFGRQGETIAQYLKKGRPILCDGRLRQENWEDKKTNEKRSKLGVVLESFTFIDSGKGERAPSQPEPKAATPPAQSELPGEDGSVPF